MACLSDETLCKSDEAIKFSCHIENSENIVSVCSSKNISSEEGYLQYRFGTSQKIELTFPKVMKNPTENFWWEEHHPYNGFYRSLSFEIESYVYTIYSADVSTAPPSFGVNVFTKVGGNTVREILCANNPTGDFSSLSEIFPSDGN